MPRARQRRFWQIRPVLLLVMTAILCLAVLMVNRGPLYYYDTGSYIYQGNVALDMILPASTEDDGAGAERSDADDDDTTSGSRSLIYGMIVALFVRAGFISGVAVLHLAITLLAAGVAVSAARRYLDPPPNAVGLLTVPLLAAAVTSLPFYIAYVMPDIFAPVLLIAIAALAAFGRKMTFPELALAFALAALAVVVHPSHMAVAGLMVPAVFLAALFQRAPARWRASVLVIMVVFVALAERRVFEFAAENVANKEVTYTPHITARLIVDGPGLDYLNATCPDHQVPTCALHEALSWSNDPYRLTVSHIIFERSPQLGSFRLMTPEDQRLVALSQRDFFVRVLLSRPFGTSYAFTENAFHQMMRYSIQMTIPTEQMMDNARQLSGLNEGRHDLQGGRLATNRGWIERIDTVHGIIYLISFGVIVALLGWPRSLPCELKLFALFLLIGIAVNALVCGGVSQPADRYGARVMWLLPFSATFLVLSLPHLGMRSVSGGRP
ncbi:hypothetical protein RUM8411_04312 [Ruegeria meonggei]|uniref:Glycosyltransferase RgtA/B/C/D-like domain-containing protein n=2 Tax=Ruegeria meonggei TaxID=1446476 RepID=A0A1X7ACI3_9RHOB|nr:hypothetical protein RUM8411_04312 [Ruegeria meonggei]